jgi:hypothetical protein
LKEIIVLTITAHHGSLSDGISPDGESVFYQKLDKKDDGRYQYSEVKQNIADNLEMICNVDNLISEAKKEISAVINLI